MRKLFLALFVLCSFFASAQKIQKVNTYGYEYNRFIADTLFALPGDTFAVPAAYQAYPFLARKATTLYVWNTSTFIWQALAGGSGSGWELTGNSGTTPGTNFIGTTDDKSFVFKVNNQYAGIIESKPAAATSLPGASVIFGHNAGQYLIDDYVNGSSSDLLGNTLFGYSSGRNLGRDWGITGATKSRANTFIGLLSGSYTQIAPTYNLGRNVGVGMSSLVRNISGELNTGLGVFSLELNNGGIDNTGVGESTLRSNVDGSLNFAGGSASLLYNTGGVTGVTIVNGGSGYTTATVTFSAPFTGSPGSCYAVATGTAVIDAGVIIGVIITNPGCGYSSIGGTFYTGLAYPTNTVTITGDGVGANITPIISSGSYNTGVGISSGQANRLSTYQSYFGYQSGVSTRYWDSRNTFLGSFSDIDGSIPATTPIRSSVGLGQAAKVTRSYQLGISDSINSFTFKGISRGTAGYVMTDSLGDGTYWVARPVTAYTFSNGLTEAAGAVKLGGTISENTNIDIDGNDFMFSNGGNFEISPTALTNSSHILLTIGSNLFAENRSVIDLVKDTIKINAHNGTLIFDTLNHTLSTTGKKIMLRDTASGLVQNIDPALLGGGSTNTSVGSGYKVAIDATNNIKSLTGGYGITLDSATSNQVGIKADTATLFPAVRATIPAGGGTPGGSNTQIQYNNSGSFGGVSGATTDGTTLTIISPVINTSASGTFTNTTGNGLSFASSTVTSGSLVSLTNTGTAAAANTKTVQSIVSSGANATSTQTVTGQSISVTNTGTSSTNNALTLTASGASINNAIKITGGNIDIGSSNLVGTGGVGQGIFTIGSYNSRIQSAKTHLESLVVNNGSFSSYTPDGGRSFQVKNGAIIEKLTLNAGTATASTAPLKFTSGTLLSTAEAGAVEFLTDKYYATITTGAARKELTLNDAALTSGKVPVATTNGRLTDGFDYTAATTYTPTLTNTTNIAASTAYTTNYTRVGNWIHVWGEVDIDATTASTISELSMTIPVATTFAETRDLSGTASFEDNTSVQIKGNTSDGTAKWRFTPQSNSNNKYSFHFSYKWNAP